MDNTNSKVACSRATSAPPRAPLKSLMRPAGSAPKMGLVGHGAGVLLRSLVASEQGATHDFGIGERDRADLRFGFVAATGGLDAQLRQAEGAHDDVGTDIDALDAPKRDGATLLDEPALGDEQVVADDPVGGSTPSEPGEASADQGEEEREAHEGDESPVAARRRRNAIGRKKKNIWMSERAVFVATVAG